MEKLNRNIKKLIIEEYLNIYSFRKGLIDVYKKVRESETDRDVMNRVDVILMIAQVYIDNINYSKIRDKYGFNIYKFLNETFRFFTKKKLLYYNDYTKNKCLMNMIAFRELLIFFYKQIIILNKS